MLGVTEDKDSFQLLLGRATSDVDERVRVSRIRGLAALKNPNAADLLLKHITYEQQRNTRDRHHRSAACFRKPTITTRSPGCGTQNEKLKHSAPEIEIAFARIAPANYLADLEQTERSDRLARRRRDRKCARGIRDLARHAQHKGRTRRSRRSATA